MNASSIEGALAQNPIVLKVRGVSKAFPGVVALDRVDLEVRAGEIHALLGANGAGKSTLIKIVCGLYSADSGRIAVDGTPIEIHDPLEGQRPGVSVIYQDLALVPDMSVAENLFLGREIRTRIGFIDSTRTHNEARRLLDRVGVDVPTTALIRNLGTGQRQLVEIAKALGVDAKLLILDEPTAALSQREAEKLFALIRELSQAGVGMIYVSHRLEEIASLADRVTVLRDGKSIGTYMARELDRRKVVSLIMGHEQTPSKRDIPRPREKGPILLETRGLTRNGEFDDVSISVRRGEVTVLTGLVGSGRTELLETIFGARRPDAGEIRLNDKPVRISRPQDAIEAGIALIPEDRRGQGLAVTMPVFANITMASLRRFTRRHLLDVRQELEHARKMIVRLAIKVPHPAMRASTLSGGNQQKVVLAKWLSTSAELFLFDEPTLGVDVGAKEELYRLIDGLAANGKGVLVCSSDFEEVMEIADRIIPVRKGRVVADLVNQDLEPSVVMEAIVHGSDS